MNPLNTAGFAHPPRNVTALGIEPGMEIADFGAGSGAYVHEIASRLANSGHVYAVDVQIELLRRIKNEASRRRQKTVEIIWADLENPRSSKIADKHLDLVLISNLLFQVHDKKAVITEAKRILKPFGRLAVIDWTDSYGGMGPHKKDVFSKDAAQSLIEASGFQLLEEFDAGAHHYGLIFRPITA